MRELDGEVLNLEVTSPQGDASFENAKSRNGVLKYVATTATQNAVNYYDGDNFYPMDGDAGFKNEVFPKEEEDFSNFRFLGIGKPSAKQVENQARRKEKKDARLEAKKAKVENKKAKADLTKSQAEANRSVTKESETDKTIAQAVAGGLNDKDTGTGASSQSEGMSKGMKIGLAVGGAVLLLVIVLAVSKRGGSKPATK